MAKKKANNIEVKLIRGNNISNPTKPDVESFKELVKRGEVLEKEVNPAYLISALDHPVNIVYGSDTIRLSPRAKVKVGNVEKLPKELPNRIYVKRIAALK